MQEFKFDYDMENDDLFVYNGKKKSKGSVEFGKLVLDFDSNKKLAAIEIMDATEFLKPLVRKFKMDKNALANIISCKVQTSVQNNFLFIRMFILTKISKEQLEFPVMIPRITAKSPSMIKHRISHN